MTENSKISLDPDHFSVVRASDANGRSIIVYYWAAEYGSSPSDSRRMFWLRPSRSGGAHG